MTLPHLSIAQRAELDAWENRRLSPEEFEARVRAPWTAEELESFESLVAWFARRYPTAGERLRAQRERFERWRRNQLR